MARSSVVTGGGSGIGRALSLELAVRGYRVVVADIDQGDAEETVSEIQAAGGEAMAVRCDVTSPAAVTDLVRLSEATFGVPDLVFSNAGAGLGKAAVDYTRDDLNWLFSLNVFGMWDVSAQFAKLSLESGQPLRIIVTGSEHSLGLPHDGMAAYTATKHATLGFAEAMRSEWAGHPASISVLCPGLSQSRLWEGERHREGADAEPDPMAAAELAAGMPAEQVAKLAVDGAERGDFYIFTHSHAQAYADRRYEEITQAFDLLNENAPSERSYDVGQVAGELLAAMGDSGDE